jgi:hypothetical protein
VQVLGGLAAVVAARPAAAAAAAQHLVVQSPQVSSCVAAFAAPGLGSPAEQWLHQSRLLLVRPVRGQLQLPLRPPPPPLLLMLMLLLLGLPLLLQVQQESR